MKQLFCIIAAAVFCSSAIAQVVFQVDAGSRAPYGNTQSLLIDVNGVCTYKRTDVGGPVTESKTFSITQEQLRSLFAKAREVGYFSLKEKYDGNYADGAGIFIAMNDAGKKHHVDLKNIDVPAINKFVSFLNTMLLPQKIRIYYGQKP